MGERRGRGDWLGGRILRGVCGMLDGWMNNMMEKMNERMKERPAI
jgi:hypothetical protein